MCLIIVAEKKRPSEELLRAGALTNPHGAGIAWREKGSIKWEKGLGIEEAIKLIKHTPVPHVIHFRLASAGGASSRLAHPFPVSSHPDSRLKGIAEKVFFHNGHINGWELLAVQSAIASKWRIPRRLSDSVLLARLVALHGDGILQLYSASNRFVLFDSRRISLFGSWHDHEGVRVSNLAFQFSQKRSFGNWEKLMESAGREYERLPHWNDVN
jgi:hypothetical protein